LVDRKQRWRHVYAPQRVRFKSRESLGANPGSGTGAVSIVALNAPGGTLGNGVKIPNAPSQPAPGSPTGVLFNGSTTDFLVAPGKPALFLFATEDGTIQGWNPSVNATTAIFRREALSA
jgi:hypothetical protein